MTPGTNHPSSGPFSPVAPQRWARAKYPLGAHFAAGATTFAVFSRRATQVLLEFYDAATGADAVRDVWMVRNPEDDVWRAQLAQVPPGTLYGFRCWGPNWTFDETWTRGGSGQGFVSDVAADGGRFNPNKVLHDPYARELSHDRDSPMLYAAGFAMDVFATGAVAWRGRPRREHDSGPWATKGIVLPEPPPAEGRPRLPPQKAAIYEAHVRGLTRHPSAVRLGALLARYEGYEGVVDVPDELRGTYAGAAYMAPYLKALGFTTLELLPIHETQNDRNPDDTPGGNYWGYMTFGFFAPDRRHAHDKSPGGPTRELRAMIEAFHREGLEVYLDVVFNHTGEGGTWNGDRDTVAFSFLGGFDTVEYYDLTDDGYLVQGATGCDNQLNCSSPVTQQFVLDSLRYWTTDFGVDGFRFDLAPVLGRKPNAAERDDWARQKEFFPAHPLLLAIRDVGKRHGVEMIAEAWDLWGDQVGNFPNGWGEWNGHFRDAVRAFCKGDGNTGAFVRVVNGDFDSFNDEGGPQRSVNLVVAHDGFTLADLVSYNGKTNANCPWPFGPTDGGSDDNRAWDSGGDATLRRQRLRNFWTVLMFSRGVPLAVAGDEFARTQNGNNNPYNLDSVATWTNYDMLATSHPQAVATGGDGAPYDDNLGAAPGDPTRNPLFVFATYVTRLRAGSNALRQRRYADLALGAGDDVTYRFAGTDGVSGPAEGERCVSLRIDGSAVGEGDFLVLVNMWHEAVDFGVPAASAGAEWARLVDTAAWAEPRCNVWAKAAGDPIAAGRYEVAAWSVVVLQER